MNINIISGGIASGKSSYLYKKVKTLKNVDGIITLCPNRDERIYYFNFISQNILLEACRHENIMLFNEDNFLYANNYLSNISSRNIIIDEIGWLEMKEKGFYPALKYILNKKEFENLFLSFRYDLLDKLIAKFNIAKLINNVFIL